MIKEFALTTVDNPFNPFDDFTSWFLFDVEKGYNSCSRLDRILTKNGVSFDDLSEKETNEAIEQAIDEIIFYDFMNIYKKVQRNAVQTDIETV